MDRDIEQAADFAYCDDKACPVLTRHWHAPAGRGDATQPDPAMIERAAEAVWAAWGRHPVAEPDRLYFARIAVSATAEHIAAAIEAGAVALHEDCGEIAAAIARWFAAAGAGPGEGSDE